MTDQEEQMILSFTDVVRERALCDAWNLVNAVGGAGDHSSDFDKGHGLAIDDALAAIERLGGHDRLAVSK